MENRKKLDLLKKVVSNREKSVASNTPTSIREKYLTKLDIQNLEELKNSIRNNAVKVTCVGLYNSGKSTLLNCLVGDLNCTTFKTADTRETTTNKTVTLENGIHFVDTPGLNAQEHDDKRVMDVIKGSDINLFIHNITSGELQMKEYEFLSNIQKHWKNPQEFIERTIFVLSRVDEIHSFEDIERTKTKVNEQIKNLFGCDAVIVTLSSKDFIDGKIENENELVEQSNILMLEKLIVEYKNKFEISILETKKKRVADSYTNIIKMLSSKAEKLKLSSSRLTKEQKKMEKDIKDINENLAKKYVEMEVM